MPALAFISGGGGNGGLSAEALHALSIDNGFGTNVTLSGTFTGNVITTNQIPLAQDFYWFPGTNDYSGFFTNCNYVITTPGANQNNVGPVYFNGSHYFGTIITHGILGNPDTTFTGFFDVVSDVPGGHGQ